MKYASLRYYGSNIGDVVQIIASSRFIPQVDAWCNREALNTYVFEEAHKIILNGWFLHRPENFRLHRSLVPLLISMHVAPKAAERFFRPDVVAYLRDHGPVGCRDSYTLRLMARQGISAYFSGCLTLTLEPNPTFPKRDYAFCVDLEPACVAHVRNVFPGPVYEAHPMWDVSASFYERLPQVTLFLKKLQQAKCVITRRLHAALPAMALGTPVIFVNEPTYNTVAERCSDFLGLFPRVVTAERFVEELSVDVLESLQPSTAYQVLRDRLVETCRTFTGYDRGCVLPSTTDDDDVMMMLNAQQRKSGEGDGHEWPRFLYWQSNKKLLRFILQRAVGKMRWWNID